MFLERFTTNKSRRKVRATRTDLLIEEQVRKVLGNSDQKLILMVRG